MLRNETCQQGAIQAAYVAHHFRKMILASIQPEIDGNMTQLSMVVDQQRAFVVTLRQIGGQVHSNSCGSRTALRAHEGKHGSGRSIALLRLRPLALNAA